jgi:hypothetical protein
VARYGDTEEEGPRYETIPFADDLAPHTQHTWWEGPHTLGI